MPKNNLIQKGTNLISNYLNPSHEALNNKTDNLELIPIRQKGLSNLIEFESTYFKEGGEYKRVFALSDFFGDLLESNFFSDCLGDNLKVTIDFKYQISDKATAKRKLQETMDDLKKTSGGNFTDNITASLSNDSIDEMHESIIDAKDLISTNKLFEFVFLVTLNSKDLDTLEVDTQRIIKLGEANGFVLSPVNFKQKEAVEESFHPRKISKNLKDFKKRLLEYNIAPLVPIRNDIRPIDSDSIWIGRTKESKQFLTVPFLTSSDENTHGIIIGKTRFGKSTLLKLVILQAYLRGINIVAIDPQGELKQMVKLVEGDIKMCGYSHSFKLLNGKLEDDDKEVYIKNLVAYFVTLNGEESLRSYYTASLYDLLEDSDPTLEKYKAIIEKADKENNLNNRLNSSMVAIFKGKLGQMLAGNQEIDVNNPFTVFDFSELQAKDHNDEFKAMFLTLFTFAISKAMHKRDTKTLFVIDEAYQILDDTNSRDFILKTIKKIGKMNTSVILSIQSLTSYKEVGQELYSMFGYKFLFRQENAEYLVNHLEDEEISKLRKLNQGEYLFVSNNKKVMAETIDPEKTPSLKPYITYKSGA